MDVVIAITRNEVTYAVDFETAKYAQVATAGEETPTKKKATHIITGEENKDWLDRQIEDAYQVLRAYSSAYLKPRRTNVAKDRIDWEKDEWVIDMDMPDNWRGDALVLAAEANRYVAAFVLARWYRITDTQRTGIYEEECQKRLNAYNDTINNFFIKTKFW